MLMRPTFGGGRGETFAVADAPEMSGFIVSVGSLSDNAREYYRSGVFDNLGSDCEILECGEWEAVSCGDGQRMVLLSPEHVVHVDMVLLPHLKNTELEDYAQAVVRDIAAGICAGNPVRVDEANGPSNNALKLPVRPVTVRAYARPAPGRPAADAQR
jgi:hypothetical protein